MADSVLQFPAKRPVLLGHRGCRGALPENTMAAFEYCMRTGCDGFEFDVRRTADGHSVVVHDAKLRGLSIESATYEALREKKPRNLRAMFVGGGKVEKPRAADIPRLSEVVAEYADSAYLYIELKVAGIERNVVEIVRAVSPQKGYVIASFLPGIVQAVNAVDPDVKTGLICDNDDAIELSMRLRCTHVMPQHRLVGRRVVDELHEAGKQVFTWTVNSVKEMKRVAECGVDGLVSDDPALLSRTFRCGHSVG